MSFEGIEASGKSSVARQVASRLQKDQWSVDLLRDFATPSSRAPVQQAVRKSLFFSVGFEEGPRAALLYLLYHESVKWERAGRISRDVMLADRFLDSVVAYQGQFLPESSPVDPMTLRDLIESLMTGIGIPVPDVTYLLDLSPEQAAARYANREGTRLSKFEMEQISQIRGCLLGLSEKKEKMMVVDASDSLERVVDLIYNDLLARLRSSADCARGAGESRSSKLLPDVSA
ncbi:dTMP kinase [Frankia sp. AgKG'84/4]|uniref:dTMP kinase n=1 Tax=Frankia sp. AgKG'84/4 TaxID=573490 RepID=UPI00200D32FC|nr:hypothetical protein [Frankia sp. AgKG'84/4]MCL9792968.1 hypothetical protein [Frankia sp. AgKG'84/4]